MCIVSNCYSHNSSKVKICSITLEMLFWMKECCVSRLMESMINALEMKYFGCFYVWSYCHTTIKT